MPGKQAPTRKRRRLADRLFDKLAHFEQQLDQFINNDGSEPSLAANNSAPSAEDCLREGAPRDTPSPILSLSESLSKPAGKMVQCEDGVRYMDSHLGAAIHEEVNLLSPLSNRIFPNTRCSFGPLEPCLKLMRAWVRKHRLEIWLQIISLQPNP
jgi:hypothetical protein